MLGFRYDECLTLSVRRYYTNNICTTFILNWNDLTNMPLLVNSEVKSCDVALHAECLSGSQVILELYLARLCKQNIDIQ
jgi:hypothetical protein